MSGSNGFSDAVPDADLLSEINGMPRDAPGGFETLEETLVGVALRDVAGMKADASPLHLLVFGGAFYESTGMQGQSSLRQVDLDGTIHYSDAILIDGVTSIAQADEPREYALHQNTPNPFNPSTRISYKLPNATRVVIEVFNVLGQRVATLVDAAHGAGRFEVVFDGNALSSGVYIYRMKTEERTLTRKMLLTR